MVGSRPQRVGDGSEYLAVALRLSEFQRSSLDSREIVEMDTRLSLMGNGFGVVDLPFNMVTDERGRREFPHFWLYSLTAVPFLWMTSLLNVHPNHAFSALNLILLLTAFWVASRRLKWPSLTLIFAGPILWWADKVHADAFVFSFLVLAFALMRDRPGWSFVCLGVAATQTAAIGAAIPVLVLAFALSGRKEWRRREFWIGGLAGLAIAAIHPIYYLMRLGVPDALILNGTVQQHVPNLRELLAVPLDPNIGLLFHFPAMLPALLISTAVLVRRRDLVRRRALLLTAPIVVGVLFDISFVQANQLNHGGTPGMNRYGLLLIPLAIPILQAAERYLTLWSGRALTAVAVASAVVSVMAFHPRLPENYLTPTRVAAFLWHRAPGLYNPLAEIFFERVTHTEGVTRTEKARRPIGTRSCSKVLLVGGRSPSSCVLGERPPAECRERDVFCYANRNETGYEFVQIE